MKENPRRIIQTRVFGCLPITQLNSGHPGFFIDRSQ